MKSSYLAPTCPVWKTFKEASENAATSYMQCSAKIYEEVKKGQLIGTSGATGIHDHFDIVFPILQKRGLSGLFFVGGTTLEADPKVLNVHKISKINKSKINKLYLHQCVLLSGSVSHQCEGFAGSSQTSFPLLK